MSYNKKQCGTVKMNILVPLVGSICLIFFGILFIISLCKSAGTGIYIVLGVFCIMSLFMFLTVNQKIEYSPVNFTYRDMFRINHRYDYSQVKKIRYSKDVTIHVGHRIILIDNMADNGKKFARIAMQYSRNASIVTDSKSKLFNGNVASPGEFVFVDIFFTAAIILFAVWGIFTTKEIHLEDLSVYSDTIAEYKFDINDEDDDRIAIKLSDEDASFVSWQIDDNTKEFEKFKEDVLNKKKFNLYFIKDDLKEEFTRIYYLSCDDEVYISLEKVNRNNRESRWSILGICVICLAVWISYIAVSSYVMCNADKYPRLIKLFVKPSYIVKKNKT